MYKHLVLWKLADPSGGDAAKAEIAATVKERLESLPGVIPEIAEFEVGLNIGAYGASFFDVGLNSGFIDEEAFKIYCANPVHDEVVAYIQSVISAEEIVDFVT